MENRNILAGFLKATLTKEASAPMVAAGLKAASALGRGIRATSAGNPAVRRAVKALGAADTTTTTVGVASRLRQNNRSANSTSVRV